MKMYFVHEVKKAKENNPNFAGEIQEWYIGKGYVFLPSEIQRGIYTVVYDDSRKGNRYGIYYQYSNGHKICVERYEDLTSCLYRLLELVDLRQESYYDYTLYVAPDGTLYEDSFYIGD